MPYSIVKTSLIALVCSGLTLLFARQILVRLSAGVLDSALVYDQLSSVVIVAVLTAGCAAAAWWAFTAWILLVLMLPIAAKERRERWAQLVKAVAPRALRSVIVTGTGLGMVLGTLPAAATQEAPAPSSATQEFTLKLSSPVGSGDLATENELAPDTTLDPINRDTSPAQDSSEPTPSDLDAAPTPRVSHEASEQDPTKHSKPEQEASTQPVDRDESSMDTTVTSDLQTSDSSDIATTEAVQAVDHNSTRVSASATTNSNTAPVAAPGLAHKGDPAANLPQPKPAFSLTFNGDPAPAHTGPIDQAAATDGTPTQQSAAAPAAAQPVAPVPNAIAGDSAQPATPLTNLAQTTEAQPHIAQPLADTAQQPTTPAAPKPVTHPTTAALEHQGMVGNNALQLPSQYTVQPGDSLWEIAASQLPAGAGNLDIAERWNQLYELNQAALGDNPDLIHPGTILTLN